jgi:hypothetical protein
MEFKARSEDRKAVPLSQPGALNCSGEPQHKMRSVRLSPRAERTSTADTKEKPVVPTRWRARHWSTSSLRSPAAAMRRLVEQREASGVMQKIRARHLPAAAPLN